METDPVNLIIQHQPTLSYFLCEVERAYTMSFQFLEIDATVLKESDWSLGLGVRVNVKVEVELPGAHWLRNFTILVCKGDTNLDNLEYVCICLYSVILSMLHIYKLIS